MRLERAGARTAAEYWLLGQALLATIVASVGLRVLSLATVRRLVRFVLGSAHPLPPGRRRSAQVLIRAAVSAGIHWPFGSTCLARALVAQALLHRHGHEGRLRLGVRRNSDGIFAAHAWIERRGDIVVGGPAAEIATYTPLPEMEHLIR
jgi:hypothetical protein